MKDLENNNIYLRALEPYDADVLYKWENDTSVWNVSQTQIPFSKYMMKEFALADQDIYKHKQLRLIICAKETDAPIGAVDFFEFDPFHQRIGIGVLVASNLDKKKGFATEAIETTCNYAFKYLGVQQLFCSITENNTASLKLFDKSGFKVTGKKEKWIKFEDQFLDQYFLQKIK